MTRPGTESGEEDETMTTTVTYQLAYRTDMTTTLCAAHAANPRHPLGPVQHGQHDGTCDECERATRTTTRCTHDHVITREVRPYMGPVAISEREVRAAHGSITTHEECARCGAQRRVNRNGLHVEHGYWGPTRATRERKAQALDAQAQAILRATSREVSVRAGVVVRLLDDGMLEVVYDGGALSWPERYAAVVASGLLDAARAVRTLRLEAAQVRA